MLKTILAGLCLSLGLAAQDFPRAEISNAAVKVKLLLPDASRGYYRATRFDWSGQIESLRTANHEYFGQWFEKYDPLLHDSILGPVEEFRSGDVALGYNEAQPGGVFVRIGVGALRKPEEKQFNTFKTYEIADSGQWRVRQSKSWIEFRHQLKDANGYSYVYTKRISLKGGKPELTIEHRLKNTGRKPIDTDQYNHNFFVIDGKPTGPAASVKLPFDLKAVRAFAGGRAETRGGQIAFLTELEKGQSVYGEFSGFGPTAADYDLRLEHRQAGAGVHIRGDRPFVKLVFWAIRSTFCPEGYVNIKVAPKSETRWAYHYQFYDVAMKRP